MVDSIPDHVVVWVMSNGWVDGPVLECVEVVGSFIGKRQVYDWWPFIAVSSKVGDPTLFVEEGVTPLGEPVRNVAGQLIGVEGSVFLGPCGVV